MDGAWRVSHSTRVLYALNATVRFVLELATLFALGRWGYASGSGALRFVLALALPLVAASIWGVFTVPGDPSRGKNGPVPVSGAVRLLLEALFFASGGVALARIGQSTLALVFCAAVCVHYACALPRLRWLLSRDRVRRVERRGEHPWT